MHLFLSRLKEGEVIRCRMRAWLAIAQGSFLCLGERISTGDDDGHMSYVEALYLARLVVDLSDNMLVDMHRRKGEQPNEELQRKRKVKRYISLIIILMMTIPTQIFSIIPHRLPKLLGVDLLRAETT